MKPEIFTFSSEAAPDKWLAFFYRQGRKKMERLPMVFSSSTEAGAIDAASKWWDEETAKQAATEKRIEAMRERRKQAAA
jgi:hypothetical protein